MSYPAYTLQGRIIVLARIDLVLDILGCLGSLALFGAVAVEFWDGTSCTGFVCETYSDLDTLRAIIVVGIVLSIISLVVCIVLCVLLSKGAAQRNHRRCKIVFIVRLVLFILSLGGTAFAFFVLIWYIGLLTIAVISYRCYSLVTLYRFVKELQNPQQIEAFVSYPPQHVSYPQQANNSYPMQNYPSSTQVPYHQNTNEQNL